ncbi:MAG: fatty acid CoA ligase family protein [Desulfobulbus sp.]|jgi:acyl-CoA synthetase (AMP-forming)/AMP-acid ligase II|nr:fatty acid CoA ligase family protein [Desulfobulbus sp.]
MMDYNIAHALSRVAVGQEDKIAMVARQGGNWEEWRFRDLLAGSEGFATLLQERDVRSGDRVMVMVRPSLAFVCLTFALFRLGAVVILIDPGMGYRNLLRCIASVRPDILVGISAAVVFSHLFRRPFATVRRRICVTRQLTTAALASGNTTATEGVAAGADDLAAIIFTTGSTGPPKGVQYTHGIFHAQLELIRDYYGIGSDDVDQPGFPLFGLFATALGARAVIPDMDPTRPAQVDPEKFVRTLQAYRVTYSFGSPAIWNVVSRYCLERGIVLPVRKVLMAGAPVPGELVERVQRILPPEALVYTPYGATESLPVACLEGREIVRETWPLTRTGHGTCVGRPLPGMTVRVIAPVDGPIGTWDRVRELSIGEIGEITVRGAVVTRAYEGNEGENRLAKIADQKGFWHRMGDMGYLDEGGRLWFCGRKAHRVGTAAGVLYTVPCEAIFNEHLQVRRAALVGLGPWGRQTPVMIVEPVGALSHKTTLFVELRQMALANPLTAGIEQFLVHRSFPVDIRHNAKIFREQLASWAAKQVQLPGG